MFNMKSKIIISVIAVALICTSFAACKQTTPPERTGDIASTIPTQPDKEHYHFVERNDAEPFIVKEDTENGEQLVYINNTCEKVSFVAHERINSTAAKNMNNVLNLAYNSHKDSSAKMMDSLDAVLSDASADLSVFPWETKVDYSCTRNDGKAISIIETTEFSSGGELTGTTVRTINFDPLTGAHLSNIFYKAGDSDAFNAMDDFIYKKLLEKYGDNSGITYNMPNLSSMIEEALPGWYFTETGVKIIFNPGSIAPIENGGFELELSKDELPENALKYFN